MPITEIISLVINFVLGSGLVGVLIFYRSKKRTANAEATSSEYTAEGAALRNMHESLVEWKTIAETREEEKVGLNNLVNRLWAEKNEDRKENHRLTAENAKLKLDLQAAEFKMCGRRGCADREPQTGY